MPTQKNEKEVLMKRLVTGEPLYKQTRTEESVLENPRKVVGAARIKKIPTFTPVTSREDKVSGSKRKDICQKFGMQMLVERVDRYDFRKSLACAPAGNTFAQIADGFIDGAKKELQKIISTQTNRPSVNVAGEGDRVLHPRTDTK